MNAAALLLLAASLIHARAAVVAPWVPLPPPIECGAVLQPNNTFCLYLRNNCTNVAGFTLGVHTIPGNAWAVPPAAAWANDTWFSFPSLSLAPNASKGFAPFSVNVFYNATLASGAEHTFGLGCTFGPAEFDCSFQPGKHFDAQPDLEIEGAPSFLALLIVDKKK
jgi:hypothetical protein